MGLGHLSQRKIHQPFCALHPAKIATTPCSEVPPLEPVQVLLTQSSFAPPLRATSPEAVGAVGESRPWRIWAGTQALPLTVVTYFLLKTNLRQMLLPHIPDQESEAPRDKIIERYF